MKGHLALGVIEAAKKSGALKPGQTVIEVTSGNSGVGLAMICAAKGYPLAGTMAGQFSVERHRLMRFLGAKVVLTPRVRRGYGTGGMLKGVAHVLAQEMPRTNIVVCKRAAAQLSGSRESLVADVASC